MPSPSVAPVTTGRNREPSQTDKAELDSLALRIAAAIPIEPRWQDRDRTGVLVDRDRPGIPGEVLRHVEPVTGDGLAGETQIDRVADSAPVGEAGSRPQKA